MENVQDWFQCLFEDPNLKESEEVKDFMCSKMENIQQKEKKGLAKKVSGMFHTIKDVFPTFDEDNNTITGKL